MLDSSRDRINFGEALRVDNGYELDFAVGTTYTLDLEAVMFLPVSLFFGSDFKVEKSVSNELLSALTKVPEKVLLFCQKGKIKPPYFYSEILAFWERSIVQVHLDKFDKAFHPKIWIIRYIHQDKNKPVRYKFICSSRNLTQCRDWDIAISFDGTVDKKNKKLGNQPLTDFIKYLAQFSDNVPANFLKEINYINFDFGQYEDVIFHPIGTNKSVPTLEKGFQSDELLIVSPFLHEKTISEHLGKSKSLHLLSSKMELDKMDRNIIKACKTVSQFNPILEDGFACATSNVEYNDNEVDDSISEYDTGQNLHAKLYIATNNENISWFIGSANCTNPATDRNIEFLTEIKGNQKTLYPPKKLLKQFLKKEDLSGGSLFEEYQMSNPTEKESELERVEFAFRKVIYEISSAIIEGEIEKNAENRYSLLLSIKDLVLTNKEDFEIFIKPISLQGDHFQNVLLTDRQDFKFSGFEEYQLSPFICFLVRHTELQLEKQFIIEIDLDLGENRKKAILKHILGNQDKLFKFLMFLLAKDQIEPILTFGEETQEEIAKTLSSAHKPATQYPMYEKLLNAASRDKESLASVISIVESLYGEFDETQQELVSKDFYELIKVFKDIDL